MEIRFTWIVEQCTMLVSIIKDALERSQHAFSVALNANFVEELDQNQGKIQGLFSSYSFCIRNKDDCFVACHILIDHQMFSGVTARLWGSLGRQDAEASPSTKINFKDAAYSLSSALG